MTFGSRLVGKNLVFHLNVGRLYFGPRQKREGKRTKTGKRDEMKNIRLKGKE